MSEEIVQNDAVGAECMEEANEPIVVEEKVEELVPDTHNRLDRYIPVEYQWIAWGQSWKKCHCGRVTGFTDNFCPSCGQHLGRPNMEGEENGTN